MNLLPVVLSLVLVWVAADEEKQGYHELVGVPEAARVKQQELRGARISGGYGSYRGEYPYMAGLLIGLNNGQTSMCGGALLNNRRVLTAAHCGNDGYLQAKNILVVLGTTYLYSGGSRVYATKLITSSDFNPYAGASDIAMLVIPYVYYNSYIKAATLPNGYGNSNFLGYTATPVGYGKKSDYESITWSQSLRDAYVPVISNSECSSYYGSVVTEGVLCTGGAGGRGPCGGDSGGPVVIRYSSSSHLLIGIMSFGSTSGCSAGHPAGHTRITHYLNWIKSWL